MNQPIQRLVHSMRSQNSQSKAQGADFQYVRELNRLLVLNCIREHGPLARFMIAQRTGLSRTTVSNIIDVLLQEEFIHEGNFLDASPVGGRRPITVHFNADAGYVIGIDVGRTHLTILITNLAAKIVTQKSCAFDTECGPEICLPILTSEVCTLMEASHLDWKRVVGIGLGIPGPLDATFHRLSSPPHMPGWNGVDIWKALQEAFDVPLYVDNDANMGALSESRYGAGRGYADLAYVKIGTGIGGGLIINGHIYRGHSNSAGELGHITIDENGPPCVCGNRGCLETLAGARAIVEDARQGISRALVQERQGLPSDSTEVPLPIEDVHMDIASVIQAAQNGNAASIAALEHAGERIGMALAGLINLFNPSAIVIDGSVVRAGEILLAPLRSVASCSSLPAAWKGTHILIGELGTAAIALGAVLAVIDAAFGIPTVSAVVSSETHNISTFYRSQAIR